MEPTLPVLFISLFGMLLVGVPVGFAIGGATMLSMFLTTNQNMVINAQYCYSGIFSFTVMAIPFFMLAGTAMSTGGIAKRIVQFCLVTCRFYHRRPRCNHNSGLYVLWCIIRFRHGHHLCNRGNDDSRNEEKGLRSCLCSHVGLLWRDGRADYSAKSFVRALRSNNQSPCSNTLPGRNHTGNIYRTCIFGYKHFDVQKNGTGSRN